ncbi:uncharacterized protein LOC119108177 [Pollicipes pollicipes]|uniref:uncharacterized protein LOC119108177 n=1 Tax=Pollicipes pollicipes TaxID=41117 RepID=UPI0018855770|nr:uncharacterized protein LOC119108177 [Pollicipes pollicipes]
MGSPPQVLRRQQPAKVMAEQGGEAVLEVALCSDPLPTLANWHWGSLQLQAGQSKGRFVAEEITQDTTEDCYRARLRVLQVTAADERDYYLKVQNDRGSDQYGLALRVKEKGGFKPTDLESEKSEVESRTEGAARQGLGAIPPDALYSGPKKPGGHGQHGGHGLREAAKHRGEDGDSGKSDSSRGGIIYADLQLPKTSNNGSMRKYRNERHLLPSEQRHLAGASRNEPARTEYAEIKFVPKLTNYGSHADVTRAWDMLQSGFRCCGVVSGFDWARNNSLTTVVPWSCCRRLPNGTSEACEAAPTNADSYYSAAS